MITDQDLPRFAELDPRLYPGCGVSIAHEEEIGSLEVGKKVDLVVLDKNLFEVGSYEIHKTQVVMTLMDGSVVYASE